MPSCEDQIPLSNEFTGTSTLVYDFDTIILFTTCFGNWPSVSKVSKQSLFAFSVARNIQRTGTWKDERTPFLKQMEPGYCWKIGRKLMMQVTIYSIYWPESIKTYLRSIKWVLTPVDNKRFSSLFRVRKAKPPVCLQFLLACCVNFRVIWNNVTINEKPFGTFRTS